MFKVCWHKWPAWGAVKTETYKDVSLVGGELKVTGLSSHSYQDRFCTKCNKYELRRVPEA